MTISSKIRRLQREGRSALASISDYRRDSLVSRAVRLLPGVPQKPLPHYWFAKAPNWGDALSPVILGWVSGANPINVKRDQPGKVLALGSNHHHIQRGDVVWGTGAHLETVVTVPEHARVLAVRGPLTRRLLRGDVPEIYGDPAVLLPRIHPPAQAKRWRVTVVPHVFDHAGVDIDDPAITIVDGRRAWKDVVDQITAAAIVVSSSLHGVIVAEAYGIPAVWTVFSDRVIGAHLKFNDYYLATGREQREPAPWSLGLAKLVELAEDPPPLNGSELIAAWDDSA